MTEQISNEAEIRARIFKEADRLYDELGRERFPPVPDVRRAARADMNTVTRVMKEWRQLQTAKPELVQVELPPALHQAALGLGAALWTEALELANANLRKAEADWAQEREDMESTRVELSQLYEEQQGELERARDEATDLRNELSAARQSHQAELEQVKAVAAEAIDRAKAELAEAKGRTDAQLEGIAARAEDLQQRLDAAQKEVFRLQAADELAQEQRKRAAAEANTQAQRFTKVQAERDEARKQAQDAGLRAARVEGELESLRESNAQLLAHVGASAAKSPAKGRSKPNKPEGQ
ncbi:DNA-binding protein [Pseudomonas aeruginosa]|uniref:DNA-binding protein n=1 Tax=Pseudomonas aeruginosa TaxID=287 RepID=UPI0013750609|nr:DNA-binding protein [Pseudomonas aeruginosa]